MLVLISRRRGAETLIGAVVCNRAAVMSLIFQSFSSLALVNPGVWRVTASSETCSRGVYGVTCRREDDGTYVVLMQSTDHPLVPRNDPPFYHWATPIRAEVGALDTQRSSLLHEELFKDSFLKIPVLSAD